MIRLPRATAAVAGALTLVAVSAAPARAQYGRPMLSDPAMGEKYHVEAVLNLWNPNLEAIVSSESSSKPKIRVPKISAISASCRCRISRAAASSPSACR